MRNMLKLLTAAAIGLAATATAQVVPFPAVFSNRMMAINGTRLFVRVGGRGPAVVLLHGFGDTGDMWAPLAADLMRDHTVIVPDLRGMGRSDHPRSGYDKRTEAEDITGVLDALKVEKADLVTHDIGNMVGFAFATMHQGRVGRFVLIDAPIPGVGPWDKILLSPQLWQFHFGGPDMERLVAGRERIYLDRFWNDFAADPKRIDEQTREHYAALYALPGAMHAGFAQFLATEKDATDNAAWLAAGNRLRMPVYAVGGEKSLGPMTATIMRFAATDVTEGIVPSSGHWVMDENPNATIAMVRGFLASRR